MDEHTNNLVVLIAGHPATQQLLRDRCNAEGLRLLCEDSLEHAIDTISQLEPSAVVIDVQDTSPNSSTPELCPIATLSNVLPERHIPAIAITAPNKTADKLAAFDAGAFDALAAPFDLSELMARIENARERSRLTSMLDKESNRDALTGLSNRARFDTTIEALVSKHAQGETQLALILTDLDHFKSVNDTQGHRFGDQVLQVFANVLNKVLRTSDKAFRYGGEEFAVLLKDTEPQHAYAIAERIRTTLSRCTWSPPQPSSKPFQVTCSLGIATKTDAPTPEAWFDAADFALYAAKHGGRDRTYTYLGNAQAEPIPTTGFSGKLAS